MTAGQRLKVFMANVPGILVYLCAAFFVPLFIARVVVRAEWRTIRNACFIWYGFLFLAFNGFRSEEHLGWAFIFAMFFSILAVPGISLVLRLWNFLGHRPKPVVTAGPAHQWGKWSSLARMSPAQWVSVATLLAGFVLIVYWQDQRDLGARADVLRQLFELPAEVTFVDLRRISKSSVKAPRVEAVALFTPSQFNTFAAGLNRQTIWQHGAPAYDGAPLEVVSKETLKWRELPVPSYAGNTRVSWRSLSEADVAKMRRGRVLCIALQFKPRTSDERSGDGSPRFSASDCSALARPDNGITIALGALDFDTRKLHMILN